MKYPPIQADFFKANRKRLAQKLPKGAIAVFHSNDRMPTNADGTMPYHQNSDLFYFSGIEQESTILVICPDFPKETWRTLLFVKKPNEQLEKWEGHKLTKQEARTISKVETVMWEDEFRTVFHHMMVMGGVASVWLNTNEHYRSHTVINTQHIRFIDWCKRHYPLHHYDRIAPIVAALRTVKDAQEIELMQKASDITEKGFRRVLKRVRPGMMEYEIEAEYIHEFIRNGSKGFAYEPVVASGSNNCILHYTENNKACKAGDLILLDVGAEYAHYNADLTRVIPVNGMFTKRQKEVYNATLRVMRAAMELMGPSITFFDYQKEVEKRMEEELIRLKLLTKKDVRNQALESPAFRTYFYHGVSHMLGLDVHDVGDMYAKMCIGSVWTVEPGIYIREEGFGVRLENNVVIKKDGVYDLTRNIPIEADEIEDLMKA